MYKRQSSYTCLKSFYYSNLNELEDSRVEDILHTFDTFSNEFLNNLSSGHSHQWTDIEFEAFKKSVVDLIAVSYTHLNSLATSW